MPPAGLWFDPGELPRVLAFVESGGLAKARREERRAPQAPAPSALSARVSRDDDIATSYLLSEVARFLGEVFRGR